jgi:probable F420-dependent oxidoreductase
VDAVKLGTIGLWEHRLRYGDAATAESAVRRAEELGYGAVWVPDVGGDLFADLERLLGATEEIVVATGILNTWLRDPAEVAARRAGWSEEWQARFLAGLGVSHAPLVDAGEPGRYRAPLAHMRAYLDALDAAAAPLPAGERVLAALGPRMLELARERAAGAHPYNVTPEHTAFAREVLGAGPILAPEQAVVLETDRSEARRLGRAHLAIYLGLPNYTNNLRRFGFGDDDFADGGSDRLVDALVARGSAEQIAARVREHFDAGADHVCLQVLSPDPAAVAERAWAELAETFELHLRA